MNYLVIIRGPLGVGKSTIAKILVQKLNAKYFSVDQILTENKLDVVDEKIGCIPKENFLKVNQIIIQDIFKNNQSVVVDGNFYYQNQIENLIQNIPFKSFVFTLTAPVEICIQRDSARPSPHGKWAAIAVHNLVSKFNYGEVVDVSNLTVDQSVQEIYSKIV